MRTNELLDLLSNPKINKVNNLKPRAYVHREGSKIVNLNGEYNFKFFDDILTRNEKFHLKSFKNNGEIITVPCNIELQGYGQIQYVNTQYPWDGVETVKFGEMPLKINYCSQFDKDFQINNIKEKQKYILNFQGVESSFNVWINEKYVGYSQDSYTTTEFDITEYVVEGINNISIEVYKYSATSFLDDQDFWRLSGIIRDVSIIIEDEIHIDDIHITYDFSSDYSSVNGKIDLVRTNGDLCVLNVFDSQQEIAKFTTTSDSLDFELHNIKSWNAEEPYLYTFQLKNGENIISKKIGFREIKIENNIFKINGEKILFRGINRHEFDPFKGRALGYEEIYKDLKLLKEHNFNAIRTSHYPNNNIFYELCDEMGFYVIDEANLETHGTWLNKWEEKDYENILPEDNSDFYEAVKDRMLNVLHRDKNNTSVVIWSLGNESYGGKTLSEMTKLFKENDSYRPVHYEGITWDRRYPDTSDFESQMYTSSEGIREFVKNNGESKPFILCEYSHAMGNSNGNITDYIDLEEEIESYQGGFIWEYMDQAIYNDGKFKYGGDFNENPHDYNFICDGLVGPNRAITDELLYVKNVYSPVKMTENENSIIIKNKNSFLNYEKLNIIIYEHSIAGKKEISNNNYKLAVGNEVHINKETNSGFYSVVVINEGREIYSSSYTIESDVEKTITNQKVEFVDGENNFGIYGEDFKVMFSKVYNNISVIEYNSINIFESSVQTIVPNFWRAPTNNDVGVQMNTKLSNLYNLTYFSVSKIKNYEFKNNQLQVEVEFRNEHFPNYLSVIDYVIKPNGSVEVTLSSKNVGEVFNFGVISTLNNKFNSYTFLGKGPYSSYCDRKNDLVKAYYTKVIGDEMSYLVPQEFGNKTDVDEVTIKTNDNCRFKVLLDNNDFSIKNYSDIQLTHTTHDWLLHTESPQLRLNKFQTGVGGDDSWENWVKDKYRVYVQDEVFHFVITR